MSIGQLTVVGTGIKLGLHISSEALNRIEEANKVFTLLADIASYEWINRLNPSSESLHRFYEVGKDRLISYLEMVEHVLYAVRKNLDVCMVSYGHPGVFAFPMHETIRRARLEGFKAHMLPSISAEDCLFADLGIDPGNTGCQSFEATDFLIYNRVFDTSSALILWQIGVIGCQDVRKEYSLYGLEVLTNVLTSYYGNNHEVVLYEAAQYPMCDCVIHKMLLSSLASCQAKPLSTLFIPPLNIRKPDFRMAQTLGIDIECLKNERINFLKHSI